MLHSAAAWTRASAAAPPPPPTAGLLPNRKNEVIWIGPDRLAGSCRLHRFPLLPSLFSTTASRRHPIPRLPAVTALQQGGNGSPQFTYKPLQGEDSAPTVGAGQEQHRRLQHQQLDPLAQSVQAGPVHQHRLSVEEGQGHVGHDKTHGVFIISMNLLRKTPEACAKTCLKKLQASTL